MLNAGESHGPFKVTSVEDIDEYQAKGITLVHEPTGCEVFHLVTDDPDNLFAFAFKTLPESSDGVAHILEHTVLCGSERFPVKDPFLLLLKGSMNTFMNAFTFPDKTVYPASSTVDKDLFNLMQVYGDAVFFPNLRPEMFRQEGHRFELSETGELQITGIVYNEMKGNYSSHDSIAGDHAYRSLFPDSPYSYDSGGDPDVIPDLTYEEFKRFHERYYHPANTRIFLYGDIETTRYLDFLDQEFLSKFDPSDFRAEVPEPKAWEKPRRVRAGFPVSKEAAESERSSVTMNWLLPEVTNAELLISFELLSQILLGHSGSPLYKVLVESDLGEDLSSPTGLETELSRLVFSVGLRGTDPDKEGAIENLILGELKRLRNDGIDPSVIEGALRKFEFKNREQQGSPKGLRHMRRSLRGWLHGAEPERTLRFLKPFEAVRERLNENKRYFEDLIDEFLLRNPHRTTLLVEPDADLASQREARVRERIEEMQKKLDDQRRAELEAEQKALEQYQTAPDAAEDVAKIPFLTRADLPREVEIIPTEMEDRGGLPFLRHPVFTNGIAYAQFAFDLGDLSTEELLWVPFLTHAITEIGLAGRSYDDVARELALLTGGFSAHADVSTVLGERGEARATLILSVRTLYDLLEPALELVGSLLLEADFTDTRRMRDLLIEMRNDARSSVLPRGHALASLRSARGFSAAEAVAELWHGPSQLLHLQALALEEEVEAIAGRVSALRDRLIQRSRLVTNITADPDALDNLATRVSAMISRLPQGAYASDARDGGRLDADLSGIGLSTGTHAAARVEAVQVQASVAYNAVSLPAAPFGTREHVAETVLGHLLSTSSLWEKIRMKGGAYGAFASANGIEQLFSLASYRDPNVLQTLDAYRDSLVELAEQGIDERSLDLAVIGTVARGLRPKSPAEQTTVGLKRFLHRVSDEMRQAQREAMIAVSSRDIQDAARRLLDGMERSSTVVMAGPAALEEASSRLPELETNRIELPS